ncbi:TIGR04086 family membrane protein [Pseudoalteromonas rubra]|uniref:TIGR04086 family membrane protein n=1 Tax=Pseudoalteromonas rubra TaxID=43658 RepID=UPI000F7A0B17|nr:TIGR04086 family membrane protein [Pseudoalteromonas rubra]
MSSTEELSKQMEQQSQLESQMTDEERLSPLNIVNRQNANFETVLTAVGLAIDKFGEHSERKHARESQKASLVHKENITELEQNHEKFNKGYYLLVGVIVFLVALVIALIFLKNDTDTAMKILTHVLAAGMGIVTGIGWKNKAR